ncbi:LuxR C-terminal-related transcriptional regulator [Sansalvadorimonas verongulae]|uniref:LuxR C-terminal-related transcriptional regulator n=1 Tax=Sansalvadorimonas verongulae TaxID=2172824 RepID=UPI0012BD6828|nr:LuxR C-terminal-related transcriptional regulator [Sansalvadorimonas verongulae]MTI12063.1 hypothetical protein [Sansalvadorimonas verongulae]
MKTKTPHTGRRFRIEPNNILTERESEMLLWVVEDKDAEAAGRIMGLTKSSAETYRKRLLAKMGSERMYGLVAEAFRQGIVTPLAVMLMFCQVSLMSTSAEFVKRQPVRTQVRLVRTNRTGRKYIAGIRV